MCGIVDGMADEQLIPDENIETNDDNPDDINNLRPTSPNPYTSNNPEPQVSVKLYPGGVKPIQLGDVSLVTPGDNVQGFKVSYIKPDGTLEEVDGVSR